MLRVRRHVDERWRDAIGLTGQVNHVADLRIYAQVQVETVPRRRYPTNAQHKPRSFEGNAARVAFQQLDKPGR
jgi:hypothetical protein